jgi:hypothetical protein
MSRTPPLREAASARGTGVERLVRDLHDRGPADPFSAELLAWLADSPRFRAFAEAHRDKIRKKLRGAGDGAALRDVRAELRTAWLLLADRRIELAFEAYGSGKAGPDFTVTFRNARSFNLEVTRPHRTPEAGGLAATVLAKLRQLPPSVPNALLIAIEGDTAGAFDLDAAARALRARADTKDEAFFVTRGFDGTRGFYERYLRLSAVFVTAEGASGDARATLWFNRSARIVMPERPARAALAALRGG